MVPKRRQTLFEILPNIVHAHSGIGPFDSLMRMERTFRSRTINSIFVGRYPQSSTSAVMPPPEKQFGKWLGLFAKAELFALPQNFYFLKNKLTQNFSLSPKLNNTLSTHLTISNLSMEWIGLCRLPNILSTKSASARMAFTVGAAT